MERRVESSFTLGLTSSSCEAFAKDETEGITCMSPFSIFIQYFPGSITHEGAEGRQMFRFEFSSARDAVDHRTAFSTTTHETITAHSLVDLLAWEMFGSCIASEAPRRKLSAVGREEEGVANFIKFTSRCRNA